MVPKIAIAGNSTKSRYGVKALTPTVARVNTSIGVKVRGPT